MGLRSRQPRRTILETNPPLRLVKSKRKRTFAQSLTIAELRNFLKFELEITEEEMGSENRILKKNNLIRPANRKTRMLFCEEKRNWTKEDWKKFFSSDETMVVIKNACKIQILVKSDKKHVPHLICCEDKKQVAVSGQNARKHARTKCQRTKCQKMKNRTKCQRTKCQITRTLTLILNHALMVVGSLPSLSFSLHILSLSLYLPTHTLFNSLSLYIHTLSLSISLSLYTHSLYLFPSLHTLSLSLYT